MTEARYCHILYDAMFMKYSKQILLENKKQMGVARGWKTRNGIT